MKQPQNESQFSSSILASDFDSPSSDQRADIELKLPSRRKLEIRNHLDKDFAKRRHDISRVLECEPTNDLDSQLSIAEDGVVEGNEDRADVLRLREMAIELFRQLEEDRLSDASV